MRPAKGASYIMSGNPIRKGLTNPPVASLGAEAVTLSLSVDSKVAGTAIERRNTQFAGQCCCLSRSQHVKYRFGEILYTAASSEEPVHVIQLGSVNWREPVSSISAPCIGNIMYKWYAKETKKGARQMAYRQSDDCIVPIKLQNPKGISSGGKAVT